MNLLEVRRWFGKLKGVEKVGIPYVDLACARGLPFHRDPVTNFRYWLESELVAFVRDRQAKSKSAPLHVRSRGRAS